MDTTIQYLLIFACVFLLVLGVATARAIRRTRGTGRAIVFLFTRLLAVGLLVYLGYRALGDFRTNAPAPADGGNRKVVVLTDRSSSMDFPSGDETRGDFVDTSVDDIRKRLTAEGDFDVTEIDFADNFLEAEFRGDLRKDASRLGNALTGVLTRYQSNAVVVISDGASTDGNPPDYVLDWAANRNIGVYAVGVGEQSGSFDARIAKVSGLRENPDVLTAHLQCRGNGMPDRLVVRLLIDGKQVQSQRIKPAAMSTLSFVLPKVAEGWHEYTVDIASPTPEVCLQNNKRVGVFRRSPPKKILFLYTRPSADYRHLSAFLRVLYPGRVDAASTFEKRVDDLGAEDVIFLILGDVAPKNIPAGLHDAMKKGRLPVLFLPGDNLKKWMRVDLPKFPLATVGAYHSATKVNARIARGGRSGWGATEFGHLRPTGFRKATTKSGATELLSLKTSEGSVPFLVSDSPEKARLIVLLSGSSWRWSLSPDPQIRSSFRGLWRRITAMAVDSSETMQSLKLDVDGMRDNQLAIVVTHEDDTRSAELKDVSFTVIESDKASDSVGGFRFRDGAWRMSTIAPPTSPSITWLKATATLDGVAIESELKAHVMNPDGAEFIDTIPHHERLQSLVTDPNLDFATAAGVDDLMTRLIEKTRTVPPSEIVHHRDWRVELTVGLIMLLVFCTDWLLERNLKEGR